MTNLKQKNHVTGVTRGGLHWWILQQKIPGKMLLVLPEEEDVLDAVDDMKALFKMPASWGSVKPFSLGGYSVDDEAGRQAVLYHWKFGEAKLLICSKEGISLPCDSPEILRNKTFHLKPGLVMGRTSFEDVLSLCHYSRTERVEQVGEYSVRGDVIDLWPPEQPVPVRLTWNFDTLEAVRSIDMATLRSDDYLRSVMLFPALPGSTSTLLDYLSEENFIYLFSSEGSEPEFFRLFEKGQVVHISSAAGEGDFNFESPPLFKGNTHLLIDQFKKWEEQDWNVAAYCHNRGERDRFEEILIDPVASAIGTRPPWFPKVIIGELEHGFVYPHTRLAVLANSEIFGRYRKRVRLPKFEGAGSIQSHLDIRPNDFLVHEKYGIGRYLGLKALTVGEVTSEFMSIEYKGSDRIYVPIWEIQQVQKYMGAEGQRPRLSSLDTASWERIKSKVKEDVAKLASDLLRRTAERKIRPGYAFPPRTHLDEEFSESFIYTLTPDQEKTLSEVEEDMTSTKSMDRLICGDVGYGKTEIAMRVALKCALAAKQVALMCPTTILAEQHARNFIERMADYPVTIKLLSRFQTKAEQKKILESVKTGGVDIVIGTHRLLSKDVVFKDLGLLIIDEEHRFGVKQKNKFLSLRETSAILSLTATPIPRTLSSAMTGIKDLSIIETPPEGRLPISTHVGLFDEKLMAKAVQSEMDRGGQVFYVHNRVKTLISRKKWLEEILPQVRIGMAHGQMKEDELEEAMHNFLHKKLDVLLATTIIESGLDIPSVNTLVVEEAEELGLAQLYQLRGRVGRSPQRAFCYLFYSPGGMTTDAKRRLEALKEYTSLGSGFRLAMRDMEIRGAGNLLGPQQHGNMAAVGIETYSRLLEEEIHRLKGETFDVSREGPMMEISLSAYLPDDYLPAEGERIQMYKRILSASEENLSKLKEELVDRCGPLPESAKTLFDAAALRLAAKKRGITEVHQDINGLVIYFPADYNLPDASFNVLTSRPEAYKFVPGEKPGVRINFEKKESPLDALGRFIREVFQ